MEVFRKIAGLCEAMKNCRATQNTYWEEKHLARLHEIAAAYLPHGSGIDGQTTVDIEKSGRSRIILYSEYHAMNEVGFYDGWIDFKVTVKPDLVTGLDVIVTGRFGKYSDLKDGLASDYDYALTQEIPEDI